LIREHEFKAIKPLAKDVDYITAENASQLLTETERMHRNGENFPTSWVLTGRAYLVLGDYEHAAAAYELSLRTLMPAPLAQRDLAFAYVQLKQYDKAEKLLKLLPRDGFNTALLKQIRDSKK